MSLSLCKYSGSNKPSLKITGPSGRINRVVWGPLNKTIISAGEDAIVRIWDAHVCLLQRVSKMQYSFVLQVLASHGHRFAVPKV